MTTATVDEPTAIDVPQPVPAAAPSAPPLKAGMPWKTLTSLTMGLALLITMAEIGFGGAS